MLYRPQNGVRCYIDTRKEVYGMGSVEWALIKITLVAFVMLQYIYTFIK